MGEKLGLNHLLSIQFIHWVRDMLGGDLGTSIFAGRPVLELISPRLELTLSLLIPTMILSVTIGFSFGILAAWQTGGLVSSHTSRHQDTLATGSGYVPIEVALAMVCSPDPATIAFLTWVRWAWMLEVLSKDYADGRCQRRFGRAFHPGCPLEIERPHRSAAPRSDPRRARRGLSFAQSGHRYRGPAGLKRPSFTCACGGPNVRN